MKLNALDSQTLLPNFASDYAWACKALDEWMRNVHMVSETLSVPWTLDGIAALSDSALRDAYAIYSKIPCYEELSRTKRDQALFLQIKYMRKNPSQGCISDLLRCVCETKVLSADIEDSYVGSSRRLFGYDLHLHVIELSMPESDLDRITTVLHEFMRPSQKRWNTTIEFDPEYLDIDAFGFVVFCDIITSSNADQAARALLVGTGWPLAVCNTVMQTAIPRNDVLFIDMGLIGSDHDCLYSEAECRDRVKRAYDAKTSAGTYRMPNGALGIYRFLTDDEIPILRELG